MVAWCPWHYCMHSQGRFNCTCIMSKYCTCYLDVIIHCLCLRHYFAIKFRKLAVISASITIPFVFFVFWTLNKLSNFVTFPHFVIFYSSVQNTLFQNFQYILTMCFWLTLICMLNSAPHQVKTQYLHFRFHANYFLLPLKDSWRN